MSMKNAEEQKPQTIMQAYRIANQVAETSQNIDEKIKAYQQVIDFCSQTQSCRFDNSIKRKVLLFWAYDKIAEAYRLKKDVLGATEFYQKSFKYARSRKDRISVLEKISLLYQQVGEVFDGMRIQEELISQMDRADKKEAYAVLAKQAIEENKAVDYLEKALHSINNTDETLDIRSRNILDISRRLMAFYRLRHDRQNWERIKKLERGVGELRKKIRKKRV